MLKYTLMLLGSRLVRVLPLWFAQRVASCFGRLAFFAIPSRRRLLRENFALITKSDDPRYVERLVRSAYRHIALNTVDFLQFPYLSRERIRGMARRSGLAHLDRALDKGKGVVFVTCHLGNWEYGGALMASLGYPTVVIAESIEPKRKLVRDEKIASLFREFRERTGMVVIPLERIMLPAVRALRSGKILVFAADRDITGQGVEVTFFGRRCRLPKGPAFFSLRMGSPIVPGYVVREEDGVYSATCLEPIESEGLTCNEAGVRELTQRVAIRLEEMIAGHPDQWFVFEPVGEEQR